MADSQLILGLDLATKTGIALFDRSARKIIHCETCQLKGATKTARLITWGRRLAEIFDEFSVGEVAIEDIFLPKKTSRLTPIWLGEIRGLTRWTCGRMNIDPHFYAPLKVKAGIAGSGRASKEDISEILRYEFHWDFADDNQSDAAAIAYYHSLVTDG